MEATYRGMVVGVQAPSKGSMTGEDGREVKWDHLKVEVSLDLRGDGAMGVATQSVKVGESSAYVTLGFDKVKPEDFRPFLAEFRVRRTSNGKENGNREEVIGFIRVPTPKAA